MKEGTLPLTAQEIKDLQWHCRLNLFTSFFAVACVLGAFFVILAMDDVPVAIGALGIGGLVVFAICFYQYYIGAQDLKKGTKNFFQDVLVEKEHRITRRGSGKHRHTSHHYYFSFQKHTRLSLTADNYESFSQGDILQVESLAYSGKLLRITLLEKAPTDTPHEPLEIEERVAELSPKEMEVLRKRRNTKVIWSLASSALYAGLFYLGVMILYGLAYSWQPHDDDWLYEGLVAVVLSGALTWRNVHLIYQHHTTDGEAGKILTRLQLIDKEFIHSSSENFALHFEDGLKLLVPEDVYHKTEANHHYWVGKTVGSLTHISLETLEKQYFWIL